MPPETQESARPFVGRRWLASAIKTASEPLPALPFDRANRRRPASLVLAEIAAATSVAAH